MAAAYLNAGTLASSASAASITPAMPASRVAGNLLIAVITVKNNATISTPSGWTKIGQTNSGASFTQALYWKISTGSEAAVAFTWTGTINCAAQIFQFNGNHTVSPIGVVGTSAAGTASPHTSTGITPGTGSLAILIDTVSNTTALTGPSGWTSRVNAGNASANILVSLFSKAATAGTGTGSVSTAGGAAAWVQTQIEIKDAPAPITASISESVTAGESSSAVVSSPGSGCTWDGTFKGSDLDLSLANTVAQRGRSTTSYTSTRSVQTFAKTDDVYLEVEVAYDGSFGNEMGVGICDSGYTDTDGSGNWASPNSFSWWGDGTIYNNGGGIGSPSSIPAGVHRLCLAYKGSTGKLYAALDGTGNWNNSGTANPVTNVGGIDVSTALAGAGPLYASLTIQYGTQYAKLIDPASFVRTVPSGFTAFAPSGGGPITASDTEAASAGDGAAAALTANVTRTEAATAADSAAASSSRSADTTEAASAGDSPAAGVSTPASASEAASAGESSAPVVTLGAAASEPVTAAESSTTTAIRGAATTEAASAADSGSATASMGVAASEAASAADAASAGLVAGASATEAASAGDQASTGLTTSASATEAASAADASTTTAQRGAAVTESATAGEQGSAALTTAAATSEAATAGDAPTAGLVTGAATNEPVTAGDQGAAGTTTSAAQTEAASAGESSAAASIGNSVLITEPASASDTTSATAIRGAATSESASAADAATAGNVTAGAIAEAGSAGDAGQASSVRSAAVSEAASAGEASDGSVLSGVVVISEPASAGDGAGAQAIRGGDVSEPVTAGEASTAGVVASRAASEAATAADQASAGAVVAASVSEAVTAADASSAALVTRIVSADISEGVTADDFSTAQRIHIATAVEVVIAFDSATAIGGIDVPSAKPTAGVFTGIPAVWGEIIQTWREVREDPVAEVAFEDATEVRVTRFLPPYEPQPTAPIVVEPLHYATVLFTEGFAMGGEVEVVDTLRHARTAMVAVVEGGDGPYARTWRVRGEAVIDPEISFGFLDGGVDNIEAVIAKQQATIRQLAMAGLL